MSSPPAPALPSLRGLALAYVALGALALAAWALPHLVPAMLGAALVVLAAPVALALWHRSALHRLARLHRFAPDRWLHRLMGRRWLGQVAGSVVALVLAAIVLLQTPWFGNLEWSLLGIAPLLYFAAFHVAAGRAGPLFSRRVYAAGTVTFAARAFTFAVLGVAWVAGRVAFAQPVATPLVEVAYGLQAAWPESSSRIVRWAVDAGAWSQAVLDTVGAARGVAWWRILVAIVVLPLTVFAYATWSAAGAMLPRAEVRRVLGSALTDEDAPAPVPRRRALAYGALTALAAVIAIGLVARIDARLAAEGRWLALRAVPHCERIGGVAYAVGTTAILATYTRVLEEGMAARRATACARIAEIAAVAAVNVDAYLDWYFSLGAEWMRMGLMVTGDVETLLEVKFNKLVAGDARIAGVVDALQADQQYLMEVTLAGRTGVTELLERQRLVVDERQCRDVSASGGGLTLPRYDDVRTRLLASSAAGVAAGAFAGALTARAMRRASMLAAGRVLGKAAAKRGVSRVGSAAAGAATGALAGSAFPGIGTGVGALAGAAAGLAVGTGVDIAMLAVEEQLTRDDMRRDLLAAVEESLAPLRNAFECGAATPAR